MTARRTVDRGDIYIYICLILFVGLRLHFRLNQVSHRERREIARRSKYVLIIINDINSVRLSFGARKNKFYITVELRRVGREDWGINSIATFETNFLFIC